MSSLTVVKNPYPYANGKWIQVGTGQTEYKFTYGFVTTESESETDTLQMTMSREMDAGLKFDNKKTNK